MGIIQFFFICLVVGLLVYLIQRFAPIDPKFKTLILWAGVIFCVLVLLYALGLLPIAHDVAIPRLR